MCLFERKVLLFFINLKNSLHFHSQNGSAVDFAERQEYLKVTLATFHHLYLSVLFSEPWIWIHDPQIRILKKYLRICNTGNLTVWVPYYTMFKRWKCKQCCGSGSRSGSVGTVPRSGFVGTVPMFLFSRIRIHQYEIRFRCDLFMTFYVKCLCTFYEK